MTTDRARRRLLAFLATMLLAIGVLVPAAPEDARALVAGIHPSVPPTMRMRLPFAKPLVFAVIGDYGTGGRGEAQVAHLVATWKPAFILTTGDDYYKIAGGTGYGRYDNSTGRYYAPWMAGVATGIGRGWYNRFFPTLGNHDYSDALPGPSTYLGYFNLPGAGYRNSSGNERYYDFVQGDVHFFALNSNAAEPDGMLASSKQGQWLQKQLAASKQRWNIVFDHNPPFSSDTQHGSDSRMQWPYAAWGADAVLSGHAHTYERVERGGMVYFVNGLGGASRYGFRETPVTGSIRRYSDNWGAMRVTVTQTAITFDFYDVNWKIIDRKTIFRR